MSKINKSIRKTQIAIKRTGDVIGSMIFIIVLSPVFMVTSILIKLTMPGNLFFKQVRIGKDRKEFSILKFRSMRQDTKAEQEHDISKDKDRLTWFGKIIRRLIIDELPQLFNVLVGDMSLVGPRPTFKEQVELYDERQLHRLDMRPGMTGLAQVNGNTALTWDERIEYDLYYVRKFSIKMDLYILLKTILVVLFGEERFKNSEVKI